MIERGRQCRRIDSLPSQGILQMLDAPHYLPFVRKRHKIKGVTCQQVRGKNVRIISSNCEMDPAKCR